MMYGLVLVVAALALAIFGYVEYQAYLLRTSVRSVAGGLRFTAHDFTVEARRSDGTMHVTCKKGTHSIQGSPDGEEQPRAGPVTVTLPAAGMRIKVAQIAVREQPDVAPTPTGFSVIVFSATDELIMKAQGKRGGQGSTLQLDRVPDAVAQAFRHYSGGLEVWIDKLERNLKADIAAREEQAAKAAADEAAARRALAEAATAGETMASPAEREARGKAQLGRWRQDAGFSGTMTDMHVDASGGVSWLIDLSADGRIILHSGQRHFHGDLKGALVTPLADELEVMVRDEFWQEGDSVMPTFRILKGAPRDVLMAWRKRLADAMEHFQVDPDRKRNDG